VGKRLFSFGTWQFPGSGSFSATPPFFNQVIAVDLFGFVSWVVLLTTAVTLFWPFNVPLVALAYRIRQGSRPLDIEPKELWIRATFASLALALLSAVMLGLLYTLIQSVGFPAGAVQFTLLMAYLAAAVGLLFWILALEDLLQAVSILLLYVLIPAIPVLLAGRLAHVWVAIRESSPWLLLPSS
jgi:hypothetical protein